MRVINIHKRTLNQPQKTIAELLETLSTDQDRIWPKEKWPAMKLDQGLKVGSKGGHGPIRYIVRRYDPGALIQFEFMSPGGFTGVHRFESNKLGEEQTELRHTIQMDTSGTATLSWLFAVRWLHDALVEDAFDKLENQFSVGRKITPWNIWVRVLRKILSSLVIIAFALPLCAQSVGVPVPTIDGDWWPIAGNPDLGPYNSDRQEPVDFGIWQARDPMVLKRGNTYYCYYTSHLGDPVNDGWAFCRTSLNLRDWSESVQVSHTPPYSGNSPRYSDECPHVVYLPEYDLYYLFVTQLYGENSRTTVYASPNPMYFGLDDDSRKVGTLPIAAPEIIYHEGQYYIAALNNELDGIRMARLKWQK